MAFWQRISSSIDSINAWLGKAASIFILLSCVISAGNAIMRYGFDLSDNWPLELQWYLFAAAVMLGASYTLKRNEHVRVDLIYARLSERGRIWVDLFGLSFFLMPACILFTWLSWTSLFYPSFLSLEHSINSGGLLRYPIKFVVPMGFFMLCLQGLSEIIKRIALLQGNAPGCPCPYCLRETQTMIPLEWMPPLMFAGLIVFMLIGFPVAFSLMAAGLFFGAIAISQGFFDLVFLQAIPQRIFGGVLANDLLLAIPFFTFMGAILERCGLAEEMLESMSQLFGRIRGGLGYSVIIVGFVLGAITGTVAAQVIAMAMISLPIMIRYGYNMRYATGVLAASGTITQLVPPSLVLIVLADQLKTQTGSADVGSMYLGAWGPSLIQIGLFALYTFVLTRLKPDWLPAAPLGGRANQWLGAVEKNACSALFHLPF